MTTLELDGYPLDPEMRSQLELFLGHGHHLELERLWLLIDQAWHRHECDNQIYDSEKYSHFYLDSIWTLNGLYAEQDPLSQRIRQDMVEQVVLNRSKVVLDWGGGIGTLARLLVRRDPEIQVDILEPHPSRLGLALCGQYKQISFLQHSVSNKYDFVLCTDVLEHLHEPLHAIDAIYGALKPGGFALFANCFEPVIQCHLPKTFYLRYGFRWICRAKGLSFVRKNPGSYSEIYRKAAEPCPPQLQSAIITFFRTAYPVLNQLNRSLRGLKLILRKLFQ